MMVSFIMNETLFGILFSHTNYKIGWSDEASIKTLHNLTVSFPSYTASFISIFMKEFFDKKREEKKSAHANFPMLYSRLSISVVKNFLNAKIISTATISFSNHYTLFVLSLLSLKTSLKFLVLNIIGIFL